MPIVQAGSLNTTALLVPDVYVQIVPPQTIFLNGVPSNVVGCVGSASWGPVGAPVIGATMSGYATSYGPVIPRKFDLGTMVAAAVLQGANDFRWVRAADGSETQALKKVLGADLLEKITYTARYTGTQGNGIGVTISAGSNSVVGALTYKVSVSMPGRLVEAYDNIGGVDEVLWINVANAINFGQSGVRGPSEIIVASTTLTDPSDEAPVLGTVLLAGGTDGADSLDTQDLLGVDTGNRTGMYALRNAGASVAALADCDDPTTYSDQVAFGLSEGIYMILTGPRNESVADAVAAKKTAGIDTYAAKYMLGDWVLFNDTVNGQIRPISPQGYVLGRLGNLAPQESSLNKPIYGLVGTERSQVNQKYSFAELQVLAGAGIDVITTPAPGGNYFTCRIGHNASSNPVINNDSYTRMTNYITKTIEAGMGIFVGRLNTPAFQRECKSTLETFFSNMEQQGQIGNSEGTTPFQVSLANNPQSRVALGYFQADCKVQYLGIVEKLLINVEGGVSVEITRQAVTTA